MTTSKKRRKTPGKYGRKRERPHGKVKSLHELAEEEEMRGDR
ncbi:hypothetical protein P7H12_10480 [Paenibacillus larvae]|nr:hypothetical protein [Paenibacillus larvae]MDT2263930.1 hypothetical protein [Paenibacillus larvae]